MSMSALTGVYRFLSVDIWGSLPASWQRGISKVYTTIYNASWSRHLIVPYCNFHYPDEQYLRQFSPASGSDDYQNFQDFFSRKLITPLKPENDAIWPAEGLLCDYGQIKDLDLIDVKGEAIHPRAIFGENEANIPESHYFSNIFLHNNNYHRIHAPISGSIIRIQRIPGELVLLRPWIYKHDPSLPALRNERINIDIRDETGKTWFLSIVGGPAVGTIKLPSHVALHHQVEIGQELSIFLLGSTCCMASPIPVSSANVGEMVQVGDQL